MSDDHLDRSPDDQISRRVALGRIAGAGVVATTASAVLGGAHALAQHLAADASSTPPTTPEGTTMSEPETTPPAAAAGPTVVLVHGSFADASGWAGVISILQAAGLNVMAPANPLRGLSADTAYIASVVSQIDGPVLLAAHSYGGAVITNAASQVDNVVGLVYVSAFIPDEGETILALSEQATDSLLGPALRPAQYPTGGAEPGTEFYIDPASFHEVFCADLPAEQAAVMAVSQRPGADVGFGEPTQNPAWKTLPSWAVVATADNAIGSHRSRIDGPTQRRRGHRDRRLTRRHDLAATSGRRRDPHCRDSAQRQRWWRNRQHRSRRHRHHVVATREQHALSVR